MSPRLNHSGPYGLNIWCEYTCLINIHKDEILVLLKPSHYFVRHLEQLFILCLPLANLGPAHLVYPHLSTYPITKKSTCCVHNIIELAVVEQHMNLAVQESNNVCFSAVGNVREIVINCFVALTVGLLGIESILIRMWFIPYSGLRRLRMARLMKQSLDIARNCRDSLHRLRLQTRPHSSDRISIEHYRSRC